MNEKKVKLNQVFRDIIIESTEQELREAMEGTGENFDSVVDQGKALVKETLNAEKESNMDENFKEPPLGVMPKDIWIELRIKNLCQAINNFIDANQIDDNVEKWIKELIDHCIKQIPEFVKLPLQQKIESVTQKVFTYTVTNKQHFANLVKSAVVKNDVNKIEHCQKICGILDNLTIVKNAIWLDESPDVVNALDRAITNIEEMNF